MEEMRAHLTLLRSARMRHLGDQKTHGKAYADSGMQDETALALFANAGAIAEGYQRAINGLTDAIAYAGRS